MTNNILKKATEHLKRQLNLSKDSIDFNSLDIQTFIENNIVALKFYPNFADHYAEIFVFSDNVQGIHIRTEPISRGGIRLSLRTDFRNEAIELAYTQRLKNACIFPSGSKGTFQPFSSDLAIAYKDYINGLILAVQDSKDNLLFVAPDRGTAEFSDLANNIACDRKYLIGNAFASGGSTGINHKKLGVTSHGALAILDKIAIENNFSKPLSFIGVGSMKGDVFGNAMLRSDIKLLAAISSDSIFIDPDPELINSFKERKRLFDNNLSWLEYRSSCSLIVDKKNSSKIFLNLAIKKLLKLDESYISVQDLEKRVLMLEADVLFLGGVGTVVSASNEVCPSIISASDLNVSVVLEGANLGVTHDARIELASRNVLIRGDFIDNVGGVICSDFEVSLKLLLKQEDVSFLSEDILKMVENKVIDNYQAIDFNLDVLNIKQLPIKTFYKTIPEKAIIISNLKNHINSYLINDDTFCSAVISLFDQDILPVSLDLDEDLDDLKYIFLKGLCLSHAVNKFFAKKSVSTIQDLDQLKKAILMIS